ncbi:amino acid adenylation domain-containing protein [Chitinophaga oryzae]|uniref:Amino acid adenylation domain-containing protein n=1 Tax=Chitinophaga oryzae TaxID=2725414 RepID=A0ABX6LBV8_9BACT|nr:amino acid adenylation domain-containing protein [Chitinophaga oryzae]QJB37603.1 amino acid adenylation domain-containing protein [Chitinophaga oryzae]
MKPSNEGTSFMLTSAERKKILRDFNNTLTPFDKDLSLVHLIQQRVRMAPESVALVFQQESLTYRQLDEQSNQWACLLQQAGVGTDSLVAFCLPPSMEKIVCMLAILKAGAAYVPLDTNLPQARLEYMLKDAQAPVLITSVRLKTTFAAYNGRILLVDDDATVAALRGLPRDFTLPPITPGSLMYVIYTSGTTGKPKGVMVEHEQVTNFMQCYGDYLQIDATTKALQYTSTGFDASAADLWLPLVAGAALFLYPDSRITGEELWRFIKEHEITALPFISPSVLATLPATENTGKLQTICVGGEACPEPLVKKWKDRVRLVNGYGPTEATILVSCFVYDDAHPAATIGRPNANCSFYILDANMQVVPIGETGELYIGGAQVARGYWGQPELTQQKFMANPFATEEEVKNNWKRMYQSGDLARYLPDGNVEFIGRNDTQVKIRGVRIELGEVENVLCGLPGIVQAVVIVHEDRYDERTLLACVVHEEGKLRGERLQQVTQEVRKALQLELPAQMIPSAFLFLEKLPVNAHGKINKQALHLGSREVIEAVFPDGVGFHECEQVIKAIWSEVLQQKDINVTDNFFDLGGHSILITQVYKRLPAIFRAKVTLPDLFDYVTIEALAAKIRAGLTGDQELMRSEADENYLLKDVYLSPDIEIEGTIDPESVSNPKNIFLTGATGFVGCHLLAELLTSTTADIYCLVRAADEDAALERIRRVFKDNRIPDEQFSESRIKPVTGDLTQYQLGIADEQFDMLCDIIDVVYHSGSSVSYIEPYNYMKGSNIGGLNEIIRLASARKLKCLALLSTVAVFAWESYDTQQYFKAEDDNTMQGLKYLKKDIGYAKTKWVMEQILALAAAKGLPTVLFRLGFVMSHSQTGANGLDQMWSMLVRNCIANKAYPLIVGIKEELVTVDYVCRAMVHITKQPNAIGKKFHLTPRVEDDVDWIEFFTRLKENFGFDLKALRYREWMELWENNEDDIFYPYLSLFTDEVHGGRSLVEVYQNSYHFHCDNTLAFLKGSGIAPSKITNEVMEAYLRFLGIPVPGKAAV